MKVKTFLEGQLKVQICGDCMHTLYACRCICCIPISLSFVSVETSTHRSLENVFYSRRASHRTGKTTATRFFACEMGEPFPRLAVQHYREKRHPTFFDLLFSRFFSLSATVNALRYRNVARKQKRQKSQKGVHTIARRDEM